MREGYAGHKSHPPPICDGRCHCRLARMFTSDALLDAAGRAGRTFVCVYSIQRHLATNLVVIALLIGDWEAWRG